MKPDSARPPKHEERAEHGEEDEERVDQCDRIGGEGVRHQRYEFCASWGGVDGYVIRSSPNTANGVNRCLSALVFVMMCRTVHPRLVSASAINDR